MKLKRRQPVRLDQINSNISVFQRELSELGRNANSQNIALMRNEGLKKKKKLAKQIAVLKRELRGVKREGREKIENIGKFFQYLNTLFVPIILIIVGVFYGRKRSRRMVTGGRA